MKKILIVDDEEHIVRIIKDRLEAHKFDVITAGNGEEALKKIDEGPDAIILDIMMPVMDGFEVLRILKENKATKDIPVIILTVKGDNATEKKALDMGADEFIEKPFNLSRLAEKVMKLLNM